MAFAFNDWPLYLCSIVEFQSPEDASMAIADLNDTCIPGTDRMIFVREVLK